jgi:ribonucleoside-diphosphate reductase alpha chain
LSKKWAENCAEERLLGVSLTGIMDNEYTNGRATQATGLFNIGDMLEGLREEAVKTNKLWAAKQLELWLTYQRHWCEHKPSVTVSVKEEEWMTVGAWVYEHFDEMSGVSFLPFSDHVYKQAPYQDCTKEEYEALASKMPKNVNWMDLAKYEKQDATTGSQELACVAGGCEI